jgi:hypothetical protein
MVFTPTLTGSVLDIEICNKPPGRKVSQAGCGGRRKKEVIKTPELPMEH